MLEEDEASEAEQEQQILQPPTYVVDEDVWAEAVTDPALWGNQIECAKAVLIDRGVQVFHNRRAHYPASARDGGIGGRTQGLTNDKLKCTLPNGQMVDREWITYSQSTGNIYCFACKLFSTKSHAFVTGYCDWNTQS